MIDTFLNSLGQIFNAIKGWYSSFDVVGISMLGTILGFIVARVVLAYIVNPIAGKSSDSYCESAARNRSKYRK